MLNWYSQLTTDILFKRVLTWNETCFKNLFTNYAHNWIEHLQIIYPLLTAEDNHAAFKQLFDLYQIKIL